MVSFEDKVVIVTGGSSGIGRAAAVAFARTGAKVVIADIKEEGGHQTVQLVKDAGGDGMFVHADVSHEADVAALVDGAVETYGRIDCAFNNAGRELNVGIMDGTEADFDGIVATNTKGVFFCLKPRSASNTRFAICAAPGAERSSTIPQQLGSCPPTSTTSTG